MISQALCSSEHRMCIRHRGVVLKSRVPDDTQNVDGSGLGYRIS